MKLEQGWQTSFLTVVQQSEFKKMHFVVSYYLWMEKK